MYLANSTKEIPAGAVAVATNDHVYTLAIRITLLLWSRTVEPSYISCELIVELLSSCFSNVAKYIFLANLFIFRTIVSSSRCPAVIPYLRFLTVAPLLLPSINPSVAEQVLVVMISLN